ncbi:hypothetical protein C5O27_18475 [Gordonia alkanivorans]|nr:hypothetical protein C5O27_18475 [Gordonia alkanivorans]
MTSPFQALLHFGYFTALQATDLPPHEGPADVYGRLFVDYEMAESRVQRLQGIVERRRLITEIRPRGDHNAEPLFKLSEITESSVRFVDSSLTPIGERDHGRDAPQMDTWRHDTGVLLDIRSLGPRYELDLPTE